MMNIKFIFECISNGGVFKYSIGKTIHSVIKSLSDDHDQAKFCVGEMLASKVRICLFRTLSFHISPMHAVLSFKRI